MKALIFAAAAGAAVLAGASVQAHAVLQTANPAPSAVVKAAPGVLKLRFNEPVIAKFTAITVTGPGEQALHVGPIAVDKKNKAQVSAPVHGAGAPGVYKVDWTAATSDMHKMKGSYSFTVRP